MGCPPFDSHYKAIAVATVIAVLVAVISNSRVVSVAVAAADNQVFRLRGGLGE